ncbi:MAG: MBL fold metallo-hydrolase [Actinobacteria bacterium]|nr:MBL fold metallo-hydrolase [Cyanobacteriota bacterium]MCL5772536.1 MBL fold metallo-hydrolase [Actinomycetota bacterium]
MNGDIEVSYYGQSLFVIKSSSNIKIGIDPYNKFVKPDLPDITVDIALITHNHPDHSNISLFKGNPTVIKKPGLYYINNINIEGIQVFHDNLKGFLRGKNIVFKFEVDSIIFAHLGDIGHIPSDIVINKLLDVDILMIPVGGKFTIDYKKASEIISNFNPRIVIPMHYRTKDSKFKFPDTIDNFLSLYPDYKNMENTVRINKENLPEKTEIWVLKF